MLALAGCGGEAEHEDLPEAGPLRLESVDTPCEPLHDGGVEWSGIVLDNTAATPADHRRGGAHRADRTSCSTEVLVSDARAIPERRRHVSAIDATVEAHGAPGHRMLLSLRLRPGSDSGPSAFAGLPVDYHNVEGAFTAATGVGMAFTRTCPGESGP